MLLELDFDPDWDSPEAIAKWRVRGIRNIHERAKEFHRIKAELEVEIRRAGDAPGQKCLMREGEIEASTQRAFAVLQERKARDKS